MVYQSQKARNRPAYIATLVGIIPVLYLSILIAPYMEDGLVGLVQHYSEINFFKPVWTDQTPQTMFVCLVIYLLLP